MTATPHTPRGRRRRREQPEASGHGRKPRIAFVTAAQPRQPCRGRGTRKEVATRAWSAIPYLHYQVTGENQPRTGNVHPHIAPYQLLRTRDGWIAVSAPNGRSWVALCRALGMGELAEDPRFATNHRRTENRGALVEALEKQSSEKSTDEWIEILERADVPCGPVHEYHELLAKEQWRRHLPLGHDPSAGEETEVPVLPIRWNGQLTSVRSTCPDLGQHTEEVLGEAGFSKEDVARLAQEGVVEVATGERCTRRATEGLSQASRPSPA